MSRLYRSSNDKMLGGVCGGLARYLGVSAILLRILFVLLALANGLGVLTYLALWILIPMGTLAHASDDVDDPFGRAGETKQNEFTNRAMVGGAVLVAVGLLLLLRNLGILLWFRWDMVAPLILVVIGAIVVLNAIREEG